ncbi:hypothetical protein [uncultured Acetobacteroides sp.]|uniref:hypothetical protein n=1 Tax=uncultured Acetobacteroides sp. TaxID=1760811 RepID=UPI0029F50E5F|nr:hypothetical protein [uncultured Acetobacteroides sp.]
MHVLLVSSKFDGEIELRYDENGVLEKFENRAKLEPAMLKWFLDYFPLTTGVLTWMIDNTKTLRLKDVPIDITFASFWERYNRKINRKRCEPLYDKLDESEKVKCIMAIKQYDFFVQLHNRAKMDPENWLKRYGWETEWSKIK